MKVRKNEVLSMAQKPIRFLIVDYRGIVPGFYKKKGIRALLAEVKRDGSNREKPRMAWRQLSKLEALQPDVILIGPGDAQPGWDRSDPPDHGQQPKARILALTSFAADDKSFQPSRLARWDTC